MSIEWRRWHRAVVKADYAPDTGELLSWEYGGECYCHRPWHDHPDGYQLGPIPDDWVDLGNLFDPTGAPRIEGRP